MEYNHFWLYRASLTEPQAAEAIEELDEILCGPDEPQFNFSATRISEYQLIGIL